MKRCLILIVGPSGVGKTTILDEALRGDTGFKKLVSLTTRKPRDGEVDGTDYRFIDRPTFESMRDAGMLVEWNLFDGEFYGTTVDDLESGDNLVKIVTAGGMKRIISWLERFHGDEEGYNVLILPILIMADWDDIEARLIKRGCDADKIERTRDEHESLSGMRVFTTVIENDDGDPEVPASVLRRWMRFGMEQADMMPMSGSGLWASTKRLQVEIDGMMAADRSGVVEPTQEGGTNEMAIKIHDGSIAVQGTDQIRHIKVDSETTQGKSYYVSVDTEDGTVLQCSCQASALNPTKKCKHQRAVIEQRILQV